MAVECILQAGYKLQGRLCVLWTAARVTCQWSTTWTVSKRSDGRWNRAGTSSSVNGASWTIWTCSTATKFSKSSAATWFVAYRYAD